MKRTPHIVSAILMLALLTGCGSTRLTQATEAPTPTATQSALSQPTPLPSDTPTPKPTATWVPTVTPRPSLTPTAALAADLLETMGALEDETEALRGLAETTPISRTLVTREELAALLEDEFDKEYPPEEVAEDVLVLAAFDFVAPDLDLRQVLLDVYSSEILGQYDDELDTFYIVSDGEFDLLDQLTFVHEYTHGLQDQNFDLDSFVDEDQLSDDEILARMALVEGDASLAMSEYLLAHISELSADDLQALQEADSGSGEDALSAAPAIIRENLVFPYIQGLQFVSVVQERGWQAVDEAYSDPPQSTEQILHPDKYLARDEPQLVSVPPLTGTLGTDWRLVEAGTLGEFQTSLYLAQQVDQVTADQASQGWDGDQYAVYAGDGATVLAFATVWDSVEDRDEFVAAYQAYAEGKYARPPDRSTDAERWWETSGQTAALVWEGDTVLIILGPDPETVGRTLPAAIPW